MKLEFKLSVWEVINFDSATAEQKAIIQEFVEANQVTYMADVIDFCDEKGIPYNNEGQNTETEEQLYPADNDGLNTLEMRNDEGKVIWGNGNQDLYEE